MTSWDERLSFRHDRWQTSRLQSMTKRAFWSWNQRNHTIATPWTWTSENLPWHTRQTITTVHRGNWAAKMSKIPWQETRTAIKILIRTITTNQIINCHPATTYRFNNIRPTITLKNNTTIQSIRLLLPVHRSAIITVHCLFSRASSIHRYTFSTLFQIKKTRSSTEMRTATICPCTRAYRSTPILRSNQLKYPRSCPSSNRTRTFRICRCCHILILCKDLWRYRCWIRTRRRIGKIRECSSRTEISIFTACTEGETAHKEGDPSVRLRNVWDCNKAESEE